MKQQLKTNNSNRSLGFTLIELLVVISIISLLIAILLPALAGARKSAQAVQCGTKLHQIGLGVTMYLNDNNDLIMGVFTAKAGPVTYWPNMTNPLRQWYLGKQLGRYLVSNGNDSTMTSFTNGDRDIYDCPTNPSAVWRIDYALNKNMEFKRASQIGGEKSLFTENRKVAFFSNWQINYGTTWPNFIYVGYWHNPPTDLTQYEKNFPSGSTNVLHIGGHVSRMKSHELFDISAP
ncbi:MAG: prepilin-type N-terminal cleavage/methylation domain-containing protein [Phycisphaeraceae bacterium]|nr:prepilin-type N-terminal cleavage/methylation domain-containing protein [Phycisphaeraceae bacterium]